MGVAGSGEPSNFDLVLFVGCGPLVDDLPCFSVVRDFVRHHDVAAPALLLDACGHVDRRSKVVESSVHVDYRARSGMNPDLQYQRRVGGT
jgi:hypothetical protein